MPVETINCSVMKQKTIAIANLKEEAAKIVLNGGLSNEDLETIVSVAEEKPKKLLCCIDVYDDGSFEKHTTTEKEVIWFVARSSRYDDLMVDLEDARNTYTQRAARAEKARKVAANTKRVTTQAS